MNALLATFQAMTGMTIDELIEEAMREEEDPWRQVDEAQVRLHREAAEECLHQGDQEGYEEHMENSRWYQTRVDGYKAYDVAFAHLPDEVKANQFPNGIVMEYTFIHLLDVGDWFVDMETLFEVKATQRDLDKPSSYVLVAHDHVDSIDGIEYVVGDDDTPIRVWRVIDANKVQEGELDDEID